MKKKLVAFAVTAAMVITSAVPVFAATVTPNGWATGGTDPAADAYGNKAVVDGNVVTVPANRADGVRNYEMKGTPIDSANAETEVVVDLGSYYKAGDEFNFSLIFQNEEGKYASEFMVRTRPAAGGGFEITSEESDDKITVSNPGIYTYKWVMLKSGSTVVGEFSVLDHDGNTVGTTIKLDASKHFDWSKAVAYNSLWAYGAGDMSTDKFYVLSRDLIMYNAYPKAISKVEVVDSETGNVVTEPVVEQSIAAKVTLADGTVIDFSDENLDTDWAYAHLDFEWTNTTAAAKGNYGSVQAGAAGEKVAVKVTAAEGFWGDAKTTVASETVENATRIAGDNRIETALAVADAIRTDNGTNENAKLNGIVVAYANEYCDALSGTALAAKKQVPMVVVNDYNEDTVLDYIKKNVTTRSEVYILGGEGVVSADFADELSSSYIVTRLGGADRYETNLNILNEMADNGWMSDDTVMVCSGTSYADALSASQTGYPILLVGDELTAAQQEFLKGMTTVDAKGKITASDVEYYAVGGTAAVSKTVASQVKKYDHDKKVVRLGGDNRYATNAKVLNQFRGTGMSTAAVAVIASGDDFPDGLTGGVYAAMNKSALILVNDYNTKLANKYLKAKAEITDLTVIGGVGAVAETTVAKLDVETKA